CIMIKSRETGLDLLWRYKMGKVYWIWYPADFELYHAMKQNFSRVERGMGWPAFWKSEGFRNRVAFRRTYRLEKETSFAVYASPGTVGFVYPRACSRSLSRNRTTLICLISRCCSVLSFWIFMKRQKMK